MKVIFILFFTFLYLHSSANDTEFSLHRISPQSGLTLESISSIVQDHSGYMWIGTNRGLFKYDSEKFERYTQEKTDSTSIPHNVITDILVDNDNRVWIATRIGLCTYNRDSREFKQFNYTDKSRAALRNNINQIELDHSGNMWLIDDYGLGILNQISHQLFKIELSKDEMPQVMHIDKEGIIWIGTQKGSVYTLNPISFNIKKVVEGKNNQINTLFVDSEYIYTGDNINGLQIFKHDGALVTFPGSSLLNKKDIRVITPDQKGQIWVGTYDGIYIKNNEQFIKVITNERQKSIYEIYPDRFDGVWIGTWSGGLFHYHPQYHRFKTYSHSEAAYSLSNNVVSSFGIAPNGDLTIGTESGGLNRFIESSNRFEQIKISAKDSQLNIKDQCYDKNNVHWVATNKEGLWYKLPGEKYYHQLKKGQADGQHLLSNDVYSLAPSDSGLWIGTHGGGLHYYDFKKKQIVYIDALFNGQVNIPSKYIRVVFLDTHNFLWVGTVNSLIRINLKTGETLNHTNIPNSKIRNDYIYSISQPFPDEIWIGTRTEGINIYNYQTDSFSYFNANGMLKQKDIYGILKDGQNNLWITSNDGLIQHDLITNTTHRFSKEDGIQGNWFYPNSILKDDSGVLYFGGTQGFSMIHPDQIQFNMRPPQVIINKIAVNNNKLIYPQVSSKDAIIKEVKLKHFERTLRIEFASDNFILSEKNKYQYRLINHYDEWLENQDKGSVLFTNLAWGKYTFEVKSCNNDGIWSEAPARIHIIIPKPLYAKNATLFGYLIIICCIAWYIFHIIKRRIRLENQIREEKNHTLQVQQLNEMKLKFFTNVSHEFRTPLSLIIGPVNTLLQEQNLNAEYKSMLEVIHRNASRLLTLINQLMDLRKLERGKEKLNTSPVQLNAFIQERILDFSKEAENRNIDFSFAPQTQEHVIEADRVKLELVLTNLLSNAFKFTPDNGQIKLEIDDQSKAPFHSAYNNHISFGKAPESESISLLLSDTGQGIEQEELNHIFNRFEQGKNTRKGSTGIGLALCLEYTLMHNGCINVYSSPGKGSVFQIVLPLKQVVKQVNKLDVLQENIVQADFIEPQLLNQEHIEPQFNKTILVIEDNNDLRKYIEQILQRYYTVQTAPDGKKAMEILENTHIDLVVSDIMMPEVDGLQVCRNIKSNVATSHIPVVLLTALSSLEQKIEGMNVGADAYVAKPFNDIFLLVQINNLLAQRTILRDHFAQNLDQSPGVNSGLDNYFLTRLNKVIEDNLTNEELDVELFTKEIGISRSQLHRKLKSLTNYSTTEYIRSYRLEKALELMKSGEYNINEISYLVGFSTHTYFSRCFKKHFNKSPKEVLKEIQESKFKK